MLDFVRKHATSWLIKVALFLIVIVFIFWGGYSFTSRDASRLAKVNDYYITISDYNQSYDQLLQMYRRQLGDAFSDELIRRMNLKQQALNMMIDRYIISETAQKLGLVATAQEVQQAIVQYPVFQTDGVFDKNRYVAVLRQNRLSPEVFEQQVAADLTQQKVENFVKRQATVTDDEIMAEFLFDYTPIRLAYVQVSPKPFEKRVKVDEKALQAFYEKHKENYKEPEKRKFDLVVIETDAFLGDVQVPEEDVKQYYADNQEKYHKPKEVRARHILFSVAPDAPKEEVDKVRAQAQKVLEEARKEGVDFAELAKKYSQDPGAANGGDLGYFTRDRMIPEFSEVAFAMKPGEVSDLVRTQYGFHILKVEDVRPEKTIPFEEVKEQIELILKREKARDIAYDKSRNFADQAFALNSVKQAAEKQNLKLSSTQDWVAQKDKLPDVGGSPEIMKALFDLPDAGISDILETSNGFVVAQVTAIKPSEIPPFEKVKERVTADYTSSEARRLAEKDAADLLDRAKKMGSLEKAAKEKKMAVPKTDWFSRKEPDPNLRLFEDPQNQVFMLDKAEPFPQAPIRMGNVFLVCQLIDKKEPADDVLAKHRENILQKLQMQKQNQLWQAWLEDQRRKADIEIYKEL